MALSFAIPGFILETVKVEESNNFLKVFGKRKRFSLNEEEEFSLIVKTPEQFNLER